MSTKEFYSLYSELHKRNVSKYTYSVCNICLNIMITKEYGTKEHVSRIIIGFLDNPIVYPDFSYENILFILLYLSIISTKHDLDRNYINRLLLYIETLKLKTMDEPNNFLEEKELILSHIDDFNDYNISKILNILEIFQKNTELDNFVSYIAKCKIFNNEIEREEVLSYIDDIIFSNSKQSLELKQFNEMSEIYNLTVKLFETDKKTEFLIEIFKIYEKFETSPEVRYLQFIKEYETEKIQEILEEFNEEHKVKDIEHIHRIQKILTKLKIELISHLDEESNILLQDSFSKIQCLFVEMISK